MGCHHGTAMGALPAVMGLYPQLPFAGLNEKKHIHYGFILFYSFARYSLFMPFTNYTFSYKSRYTEFREKNIFAYEHLNFLRQWP